MAYQNKIFQEYLNLVHKNWQSYEIIPFMKLFDNVYLHFQIWTRIRNPRVTDPDPAKVPDPCGSRSVSTTLIIMVPEELLHNLELRAQPRIHNFGNLPITEPVEMFLQGCVVTYFKDCFFQSRFFSCAVNTKKNLSCVKF
jgi:hypothetical protein